MAGGEATRSKVFFKRYLLRHSPMIPSPGSWGFFYPPVDILEKFSSLLSCWALLLQGIIAFFAKDQQCPLRSRFLIKKRPDIREAITGQSPALGRKERFMFRRCRLSGDDVPAVTGVLCSAGLHAGRKLPTAIQRARELC